MNEELPTWSPPEKPTLDEMKVVAMRTKCPDMNAAMGFASRIIGVDNLQREEIQGIYNQISLSVQISGAEGDAYPDLSQDDWDKINAARASFSK